MTKRPSARRRLLLGVLAAAVAVGALATGAGAAPTTTTSGAPVPTTAPRVAPTTVPTTVAPTPPTTATPAAPAAPAPPLADADTLLGTVVTSSGRSAPLGAPFGGGSGSGPTSSPSYTGSAPSPKAPGPDAPGPASGYRTPVNPTTSYPARATAVIEYAGQRVCTGFLIGPSTVVTAGHCVAPARQTWRDPAQFRIIPAKNGNLEPFGSCGTREIATVAGWFDSKLVEYDYGAIQLDCTIGNTVGWYGFFWTTNGLINAFMTVSGYPSDVAPNQQWKSVGRTVVSDNRRVYYSVPVAGQAGSPVWTAIGFWNCDACAMAIHTYTGPPTYSLSSGTRINRSVFRNLYYWKYGVFPPA